MHRMWIVAITAMLSCIHKPVLAKLLQVGHVCSGAGTQLDNSPVLYLSLTSLIPGSQAGAIKVFAREVCRNDVLNFGGYAWLPALIIQYIGAPALQSADQSPRVRYLHQLQCVLTGTCILLPCCQVGFTSSSRTHAWHWT
jgi:hypothetical protein